MKLTQQQMIFLRMAKQGTATLSTANKTGRALKALGLVSYTKGVGYVLTPKGCEAVNA